MTFLNKSNVSFFQSYLPECFCYCPFIKTDMHADGDQLKSAGAKYVDKDEFYLGIIELNLQNERSDLLNRNRF